MQKHNSNFETYEIHLGLFEVRDVKNVLDKLVKTKVPNDVNSAKSQLKTNPVLQLDEKSVFISRLGLRPNCGYAPNIEHIIPVKVT